MENASWTKRIAWPFEDVADSAFQQRAWLGTGPEVSSFVETYCALYDDTGFDAFLAQPGWEQTGLSAAGRQEMARLD